MEDIILCVLVAYLLSLIIHLILGMTGLWDKIVWVIKLPKSKKYNNKVDPIYEIREHIWGNSDLYIYKWSLRYEKIDSFIILLLLFIPYPIFLEKFGYYVENSMYLCEKKKAIEITEDLKTIYENKMEKIRQENRIKDEKRKTVENRIDELNQIFNENYE